MSIFQSSQLDQGEGRFGLEASSARIRPSAVKRAVAHDGVLTGLYVVVFAIVAFLALVPLAALVIGSLRDTSPGMPGQWTLANWANLASPGVVETLLTTLEVAGLSTLFAMVMGTALALVIHRTDFHWPSTMTGLLGLSFYFPSFILAMAWIVIGSPGGVINDLLRLLNIESVSVDIYSAAGIIFVMVLHQVPFVYLTIRGPIRAWIRATRKRPARRAHRRGGCFEASRCRCCPTRSLPAHCCVWC